VGGARGGEEAGPAAPADAGPAAPADAGPDARSGHWPGVGDFDDLVRRYRRELHVYCYRMLGSFDEAEDHVQEALLRAWRSRERFEQPYPTRCWTSWPATRQARRRQR
jgi:hypothetical protein